MAVADAVERRNSGMSVIGKDGFILSLFTVTIFLSALLLFVIQPMYAKMVLPYLGGSPSVWAVSMCFFQAVLLAGYAYAFGLNRYLKPRHAVITHIGVLTLACLVLPISLPAFAAEVPSSNPYLWLVAVLFFGVGLPFFAVSANAPLLQAWFGKTGHVHAKDPYFLYGASNLGSLLALLSYPVLVEPVFKLGDQSGIWTALFFVLTVAIASCGIVLANRTSVKSVDVEEADNKTIDSSAKDVSVSHQRKAIWIALAFVPSALLVAFTTFITTDVASAPFLWVLPLAAFLATFSMTFCDKPLIPHRWLLVSLPVIVAMALIATTVVHVAFVFALPMIVLAFLATTLVCHRELYLLRPHASRLTEFYLWMSFGGVLGGIFTALIAPLLFTSIIEFPLLLLAGLALRLLFVKSEDLAWDRKIATYLAAFLGVLWFAFLLADASVLAAINASLAKVSTVAVLAFFAVFCAIILTREMPKTQVGFVALFLTGFVLAEYDPGTIHTTRSFFGVSKVLEKDNGQLRVLSHGTTVHGAILLKDENGKKLETPRSATYYTPTAPMIKAIGMARNTFKETPASGKRPFSAGVVGLGAGVTGCSFKRQENVRYFELDPEVVRIARNPEMFDFLTRCVPNATFVVGDARLTLAKEPANSFDYILIDAFSSDAVPTHLLTVESFKMYLDKLEDHGLLAIHISNRFMDLASVVAAGVEQIPGYKAVFIHHPGKGSSILESASNVVLISKNEAMMSELQTWDYASIAKSKGVAAWTDDYSDTFSAIVRGSEWSKID